MPGVSLNPRISPDLKPKLSLMLLAGSVCEWCLAAGGSPGDLDTVRKGIYDNQVFEAVYIVYARPGKEKVAELVFRFDWEKHTVSASRYMSDLLAQVDPQRPITEQIMTEFTEMIREFRSYAEDEKGATELRFFYQLLEGIRQDEALSKKWRDWFGFADVSSYGDYKGDVSSDFIIANEELCSIVESEFRL